MGYCVDVNVKVIIPKDKKEEIIATFKALDKKSPKGYHWVEAGFSKQGSVEDMFAEWGYECVRSPEDDYVINGYNWEKMGDDDVLWKAVAPLVTVGSYVEFHGEDHAQWKYVFKDGKMEEKRGRTVYE